jgi:hypothetical protein
MPMHTFIVIMKFIIRPLRMNQGSYKVYRLCINQPAKNQAYDYSQQKMKCMIMFAVIILAMAMMVAWGLLTTHEYRCGWP